MNAKPEILVFTETWVYTYEVGLYSIHGYRGYFTCQDSGMAGGVAVYIRDDLTSCFIASYLNNVEACVVDTQINGKWLRITGMYRSPNRAYSNFDKFIETDLVNVLNLDCKKPADKLIVGDLNIDISKQVSKTEEYMNLLAEHGYEWLETGITRKGKETDGGTIIDHSFLKTLNIKEATCTLLDLQNELDHKVLEVCLAFPNKNGNYLKNLLIRIGQYLTLYSPNKTFPPSSAKMTLLLLVALFTT